MLTITIKANVPAADAQGIKERIAHGGTCGGGRKENWRARSKDSGDRIIKIEQEKFDD